VENTNPTAIDEQATISEEQPTIVPLEEQVAEGEGEQPTEGDGKPKKHAKPILYMEVDGEQVRAERMWTSHLFPQADLREFYQFCRDTGQKPVDLTSKFLADGMVALFAETERTKADRETARAAKALPTDQEVLERQEAALATKMAALQAKMQAVKERAAAMRAAPAIAEAAATACPDDTSVEDVEAMLNEVDGAGVHQGRASRKKG
jgi:hypothetical protein